MSLSSTVLDLTTSPVTLVTCATGTEGSLHGLTFGNRTGVARTVTMTIYKSLTATTTTLGAFTVGANSNVAWPKPINLQAGDYIQVSCDAGSAVCAEGSYYSASSSTPVASGFNPKGAWASGTTYAVNDVVTVTGNANPALNGSYLSRVAGNVNHDPTTSPTYWQPLYNFQVGTYFYDRGTWSSATAYVANDLVTYNGSKFVCVAANTNSAPNIRGSNANWLCIYQTLADPVTTIAYTSTINVDTTSGVAFYVDATGNFTLNLTNPPSANNMQTVTLIVFHDGAARSITWNANISWTDGVAPVTATVANATDIFTFFTYDGGTTWKGSLVWWSAS